MQPVLVAEPIGQSVVPLVPLTHADHPPEDFLSFLKETMVIAGQMIDQVGGREATEIARLFPRQGIYPQTFLKWVVSQPEYVQLGMNFSMEWTTQSVLHVGRSKSPLHAAIACVWDGFFAPHWGNPVRDARVINAKFLRFHQLLLTPVPPKGAQPWI